MKTNSRRWADLPSDDDDDPYPVTRIAEQNKDSSYHGPPVLGCNDSKNGLIKELQNKCMLPENSVTEDKISGESSVEKDSESTRAPSDFSHIKEQIIKENENEMKDDITLSTTASCAQSSMGRSSISSMESLTHNGMIPASSNLGSNNSPDSVLNQTMEGTQSHEMVETQISALPQYSNTSIINSMQLTSPFPNYNPAQSSHCIIEPMVTIQVPLSMVQYFQRSTINEQPIENGEEPLMDTTLSTIPIMNMVPIPSPIMPPVSPIIQYIPQQSINRIDTMHTNQNKARGRPQKKMKNSKAHDGNNNLSSSMKRTMRKKNKNVIPPTPKGHSTYLEDGTKKKYYLISPTAADLVKEMETGTPCKISKRWVSQEDEQAEDVQIFWSERLEKRKEEKQKILDSPQYERYIKNAQVDDPAEPDPTARIGKRVWKFQMEIWKKCVRERCLYPTLNCDKEFPPLPSCSDYNSSLPMSDIDDIKSMSIVSRNQSKDMSISSQIL